jgi:beta-phosphoglucomutase-like phosphatase (HAD superfamily)
MQALFLSHFGEDFLFDDFHANWVRHFWLIAKNTLSLNPGALELLEILDQFRLPRAIATSSSRNTVERHLTSHGLTDRFDQIICRGDYEKGKPAPDPFLRLLNAWGSTLGYVWPWKTHTSASGQRRRLA